MIDIKGPSTDDLNLKNPDRPGFATGGNMIPLGGIDQVQLGPGGSSNDTSDNIVKKILESKGI